MTQVNKILKNLESKKLIKAVKSVAVSMRTNPACACQLFHIILKRQSHAILVHFKNKKICPHINERPQIMV